MCNWWICTECGDETDSAMMVTDGPYFCPECRSIDTMECVDDMDAKEAKALYKDLGKEYDEELHAPCVHEWEFVQSYGAGWDECKKCGKQVP